MMPGYIYICHRRFNIHSDSVNTFVIIEFYYEVVQSIII